MSHAVTPTPAHARRWYSRRDVLGPAAILTVGGSVVVAVWVLTGWWSLTEQTHLARLRGFTHPEVLFWATDAFAVACALVALAAAVDNRPAPLARLGYALALCGSAYFNAEAAAARLGEQLPADALAMAAGVPLASFAALEIILAAVRATVRRWRGLPAPVGAPSLRLGRLLLGGVPELARWRTAYLDATRPGAVPVAVAGELRDEVEARYADALTVAAEGVERLRVAVAAELAELREQLPTTAPALDREQLRAEVASFVMRSARAELDNSRRELLADLDSRVAALRESLPRETPAPRSRPTTAPRSRSTGSGSDDTARMRAHWDRERAAGRTPTGAELDREVGRDPAAGYGRQLRKRWLAEEEAGVSRIPARATAGA